MQRFIMSRSILAIVLALAALTSGSAHAAPRFKAVAFAAFGGWDAYGAKSFGYPTYWVNRFSLPAEKLGLAPDATSNDFAGLLKFVLGG
jgi:2-haloacid dehalogenase